MVLALEPAAQLITVMRTPRMSGLALRVHRPEHGRGRAQVTNQTVAGPRPCFKVSIEARIAHGSHVALHRHAAVIQQGAEITPARKPVLQWQLVQLTPGPS